MQEVSCITELIENVSSKFWVKFLAFFLALSLGFCWYQWKFVRAYRHFPSKRLETKCLLPIIMGKFPRKIPLTSFVFQVVIEAVNSFLAEGLCVLWFLRPYVFVYSEEFMKDLVNEVALADKSSIYDLNALIIGNGLLLSKHEMWRAHRKLLNPAFNLSVLKGKMQTFNGHGLRLVEKLGTSVDKPTEDVSDVLKDSSFHIMADCVLDLQVNNIKSHEMLSEDCMRAADSGTKYMVDRTFRPWLHWDFLLPLFQSGRKYLEAVDEGNRCMHIVIKEMLESAISEKEDPHNPEGGFMKSCGSILIKQYLQNPNFTEKKVRDHIMTLAVAGYETISITLMWCFYLLGLHTQEQEKAYNEVKSVVPEGDLTYDDISKMKYLDCVIKETLRLYPAVPIYARKASKEIRCGQYTIPKGTEVVFFAFMLHRNPNIFPQPEKFDPDRFSDSSKIRPWAFIPFSEGYRNCIGKKFSMIEMKVLLAHVIRRFKITSLNKIDVSELDWTIILKPAKPPFITRVSSPSILK